MKEKFKPISGFEGLYEISNLGRVRSLYRQTIRRGRIYYEKERIMKLRKVKSHPYLYVSLCKDGIGTGFQVHRLVALAFVPNPKNKPQVNHKDFNPENNTSKNLNWVTVQENHDHSFHRKASGLKNGKAVEVEHQVTGKIYTLTDAAKESCYSMQYLCDMLKGRRPNKTAFEYKNKIVNV